jgi:hypothetical protein
MIHPDLMLLTHHRWDRQRASDGSLILPDFATTESWRRFTLGSDTLDRITKQSHGYGTVRRCAYCSVCSDGLCLDLNAAQIVEYFGGTAKMIFFLLELYKLFRMVC